MVRSCYIVIFIKSEKGVELVSSPQHWAKNILEMFAIQHTSTWSIFILAVLKFDDNVLGKLTMERFRRLREYKGDIIISENLHDLFVETEEVFRDEKIEDDIERKVSLPNIEKIIQELNKGKTPVQLDFSVGGENGTFQNKAMQLRLDENNIEFLQYLQSDICANLLKETK